MRVATSLSTILLSTPRSNTGLLSSRKDPFSRSSTKSMRSSAEEDSGSFSKSRTKKMEKFW